MNVVGFDTSEMGEVKTQAQWFWDVWNKNKMDTQQANVHERTVSESECFIVMDWDKTNKYPVMIVHERYTDPNAAAWEGRWDGLTLETMEAMSGSGQGVWMVYENDDPNQAAKYAVQQWTELYFEDERINSRLRRTIYYPDRIERYFYDEKDWKEFQPVQPWTKDGKPIGIPVIHFKNKDMRPEAWDAIPAQDAINKTWVDILGSADLAGYPLFVLLGLYPTTDGKPPAVDGTNVWAVGPAQMLGNASVKAGEASVQKFEGSDPTYLMNVLKDQIMFVAQITDTPVSHFITTAQVAAADTLKEQERRLRQRAQNRMVLMSDSWEDCMIMARRINNAFGGDALDENITIEAVWRNLDTLDDLKEEQALGVPQEMLWIGMGKTQEQIIAMKNTVEYRLKFLTSFWAAYSSASASGATVESFAKSAGLKPDEIKLLTAGMGDGIPTTTI